MDNFKFNSKKVHKDILAILPGTADDPYEYEELDDRLVITTKGNRLFGSHFEKVFAYLLLYNYGWFIQSSDNGNGLTIKIY